MVNTDTQTLQECRVTLPLSLINTKSLSIGTKRKCLKSNVPDLWVEIVWDRHFFNFALDFLFQI